MRLHGRIPWSTSSQTGRISNRPNPGRNTSDKISLSSGFIGSARTIQSTPKPSWQNLYPTKLLFMRSTGIVSKKEGWIVQNMHRLSRVEQTRHQELICTPEDRWPARPTTRIPLLLKDWSKIRLSSTHSSKSRHSKVGIQDLVQSLLVSIHAIRTDQRRQLKYANSEGLVGY